MNKLLPKVEDLVPILDGTKTFCDSPLKKKFEYLDFENQLQVVNDLVRQTMLFSDCPDPSNHVDTLRGDSYTASLVSVEYLKSLNLGKNYKIVFAWKKNYETDNTATTNIVTLVSDENNKEYLFDATPIVGYKCGRVECVNNDTYKEYIEITGELKKIYETIRNIKYICLRYQVNEKDLCEYLNFLEYAKKYDILKEYIEELKLILQKLSKKEKITIENNYKKMSKHDIIIMLKQVRLWSDELNELILGDINYARQIELSQCITNVLNVINGTPEKKCIFKSKEYKMSHLSPRLFLEEGLNLIFVKPSAYFFGWENIVKQNFLEGKYDAIGEYNKALGIHTDLGLKPMHLFHPHGYKYERAMTGPTSIFLIERNAEEILEIKKTLRKQLKQEVNVNEVIWFDGKPIVWDPICLNFAHTSDDPCEACMGYTSPYPQYQLMTRFMYPNPLLAKEEKNARI